MIKLQLKSYLCKSCTTTISSTHGTKRATPYHAITNMWWVGWKWGWLVMIWCTRRFLICLWLCQRTLQNLTYEKDKIRNGEYTRTKWSFRIMKSYKCIRHLPPISYFSVFCNAFMALDLSAKCTKPNLLFSCPAFAGGTTTFVIFPWWSKSAFRSSWVMSFGRFLTYTALTCTNQNWLINLT